MPEETGWYDPADDGDYFEDEPHDDSCYDEFGRLVCNPCGHCGSHHCPGYCDDHQTYNLRPAETGGQG